MEIETAIENGTSGKTHPYTCNFKNRDEGDSCRNTPSKGQSTKQLCSLPNQEDTSAIEPTLAEAQEKITTVISGKVIEGSDQSKNMVKDKLSKIGALGKALQSIKNDLTEVNGLCIMEDFKIWPTVERAMQEVKKEYLRRARVTDCEEVKVSLTMEEVITKLFLGWIFDQLLCAFSNKAVPGIVPSLEPRNWPSARRNGATMALIFLKTNLNTKTYFPNLLQECQEFLSFCVAHVSCHSQHPFNCTVD